MVVMQQMGFGDQWVGWIGKTKNLVVYFRIWKTSLPI